MALGRSVSLTWNGHILAVGGPADGRGIGATWIFVNDGSRYQQRGPKLVGTGASGSSQQGKIMDTVRLWTRGISLIDP